MDIAQPDNGADKTIVLRISGNRLVGILNTLDAMMYGAGKYRLEGDKVVADCPYGQRLYETTEAIRDELSAQRNNTTAEDIRATTQRIAAVRKDPGMIVGDIRNQNGLD